MEPEEEGEEPQVPAMPRACRGPAQGFASPKGPTTGQGGGRAFWAWGSLVEFPVSVNIPRPRPFLICHIRAEEAVTSCSQKGNLSPGLDCQTP